MKRIGVLLLLIGLPFLASCGIKGDPLRPPAKIAKAG